MPGAHTFASKAQMRWAFATRKTWAHRWGEATEAKGGYHSLPPRKRPPSPGRALKAFGARVTP